MLFRSNDTATTEIYTLSLHDALPIAEPADAEYVLARARHCDGFYGASSMERLPVERALSAQVAKFKSIKKANHTEQHARGGPQGRRAGRE